MNPLLDVQGLVKHFPVAEGLFGGGGVIRAVDDVSFTVPQGTVLGLVGESGSGKTTIGKTLLRLHEPTTGRVLFDGVDVFKLGRDDLRRLRRRLQIVHQNPNASLHPRQMVLEQVRRPLVLQRLGDTAGRTELALQMLRRVGLNVEGARRYPHEFSGGQRQRIAIARALITNPEFVVLDEPTSALDVSVQAQILQLLRGLQHERGLTYLFISHDLGVVRHMCDEVIVLYLGRLVEHAPRAALFAQPLHPYTQALLSVVPIPDPRLRRRERILLAGEIPSPRNPPAGCRFHTRCPLVTARCRTEEPRLKDVGSGRRVACHLVE